MENVVARLTGCEGSRGIKDNVTGEPIAPVWTPECVVVEDLFHPPAPIPVKLVPA